MDFKSSFYEVVNAVDSELEKRIENAYGYRSNAYIVGDPNNPIFRNNSTLDILTEVMVRYRNGGWDAKIVMIEIPLENELKPNSTITLRGGNMRVPKLQVNW